MSLDTFHTNPAVVLGLNINALGTIRSLNKMGIPVIGVDSKSNYRQIHSWMSRRTGLCKKVYYQNFGTEEAILDCLIDLGKKLNKKGIVFPSNDLQMLCVSNKREVLSKYYYFLLPDKETINLLNNKILFYKYAMHKGIDIPQTFFTDSLSIEEISEKISYPCLIKPFIRDNNWQHHFGDEKAFIKDSHGSLIRSYYEIVKLHKELIIQEVIPGTDDQLIFSFIYFNKNSEPLATFTGRKIRQLPIKYGTSSMAESIWDPVVVEKTIQILTDLKYRGYASIEFKKDPRDGKYKVMEITTGRTWYPHALSTACGINIPYIWYQYLIGNEIKVNKNYRKGVKWIDEYRDIISGYRYWKEGEITIKDWIKSYKGKKTFALFSLKDPMPGIFVVLRILIGISNNIQKIVIKLNSFFTKLVRKINKSLKQRIKYILYFLIYYSGILNLFIRINKNRRNHSALILIYHRIIDQKDRILYKSYSVHHLLKDFEKEMAYLKKTYKIISLNDLVSKIKENRALDAPSIVITFDDGYQDNYRLAYPILKKYSIPATIFLTTSLIGTKNRTWLDEIEYALINSKAEYFKLSELFGNEIFNISTMEEKRKVNNMISSALKAVNNNKRLELLRELYTKLEVKPERDNYQERLMLNWNEIEEMRHDNISFEPHSHTHPILSKMPVEEAKKEILISKSIIEDKIKTECRHFAFPNGRDIDFSQKLMNFCKEIGLESILAADGNKNSGNNDIYSLKRLPIQPPLFFSANEIARSLFQNNKYRITISKKEQHKI